MRRELFAGDEAFVLESECLRAVILPKRGGKMASCVYKPNQMELLFQNPLGHYRNAKIGDDFTLFDASGFDDAFPSIDAGVVSVGGQAVAYPDHGEIWSAAFTAQSQEKSLKLQYRSRLLPYLYEKEWCLTDSEITCQYTITHTSGPAFPYIWAMHGLFRDEPGLVFSFPHGVETVRSVYGEELIGPPDSLWQFPVDAPCGKPYDFRAMPPEKAVKYYAEGKVQEGRCGLRYTSSGTEVEFLYDHHKLPFLALWATSGGFRGDCNCALEPCSGFYDSIEKAQKLGLCSVLKEGETLQFSIAIHVSTMDEGVR